MREEAADTSEDDTGHRANLRREVTPEAERERRDRERERDHRRRGVGADPRGRRRREDSRSRGRRRRSSRPQGRRSEAPFGHLPPPEPSRPPPARGRGSLAPPPGSFYSTGWWPNRFWEEDIRAYGPDPQRKYQREQRDRGR